MIEVSGVHLSARGEIGKPIEIIQASGCQRGRHCVRTHAVFQIGQREYIFHTAKLVTQVSDICTVGQHVRNLKDITGFGVRVAAHADSKALAPHVVGFGLTVPDPFNTACAVTQGNEFLKKLGMCMLDVIQIQHDVIAHLEG